MPEKGFISAVQDEETTTASNEMASLGVMAVMISFAVLALFLSCECGFEVLVKIMTAKCLQDSPLHYFWDAKVRATTWACVLDQAEKSCKQDALNY